MSGFRESEFVEVASGLEYPEGPVYLSDGSLAAVDVKAGTLLRFKPDAANRRQVCQAPPIQLGGSPNGRPRPGRLSLYLQQRRILVRHPGAATVALHAQHSDGAVGGL